MNVETGFEYIKNYVASVGYTWENLMVVGEYTWFQMKQGSQFSPDILGKSGVEKLDNDGW